MHFRSVLGNEYIAPLAPAALVAAVRLLLGPHLTETFQRTTETRREYPC